MSRTFYKLASLLTILVVSLTNPLNAAASTLTAASAAGEVYYISPTGRDTNTGRSANAPFKTFAMAVSKLIPGSTLTILPGTYHERLLIKKSGTAAAPIIVNGSGAIIDMQWSRAPGIDLKGAYITVTGLDVRNDGEICVNLANAWLTVTGLRVHNCKTHGIHAYNASHVRIVHNKVFNTVLQNAGGTMGSSWGSAIKIRESNAVQVLNNSIHNNYGEGIGARGTNVIMRGNIVYDNFSVNIYSNSENSTIERNFVFCTGNSAYYRSGKPAGGIVMGEEYYAGWGARLKNARVINNVVTGCKNGIRYNGADSGVAGGGLKYATIAHNTLYGSVEATLSIMYGPAQAGNVIANNIIWQANNSLASIENSAGLTFRNNLWKVAPPVVARGVGDRYGAPGFAANPPGYTPGNFRPGSSSLAIAGALDLNITIDYYGTARSLVYDIGAIEGTGSGAIHAPAPADASAPVSLQAENPSTPASTEIQPGPTVPPAEGSEIPPAANPGTEQEFDDQDPALDYSDGWNTLTSGQAFGDSFQQTQVDGAAVTFSFTGTSFSLIYKGGPSYGSLEVFVDGTKIDTINQRRDTSAYNLRWDYPGTLDQGRHTVQFVFLSDKAARKGSLDAVLVR